MYKILSAVAMSGLLFAAGGASAQVFPGSGPWTLGVGGESLNLYQTVPNVSCVTQFTVQLSGGSYSITGGSFSPGHAACGTQISAYGFPWALTVDPTTNDVTIYNVKVDAVYGICDGTISGATYDTVNQIISIPVGTTIPGYLKASPSTSIPCEVDGDLSVL